MQIKIGIFFLPIGGWDQLLVESQPSAETLFEWLNGSEAERLTAIRAVCQMMQQEIKPSDQVEKAAIACILEGQ